MEKGKLWKQEVRFHLGLQFLIAIFITIASYVYLPFDSLKGNIVYGIHFLLLHFSLFGFVYVISLFGKLFRILFPLIFIIISSLAYWVYTQDLTIGEGLIEAIFETNIDIALDLFHFQFVIYVILVSIIIIYFFRVSRKLKISSVKSPLFIMAIFGIMTFFSVENYKYDAFKNRLPYNVYFGTLKYLSTPKIYLKEVTEKVYTKENDLHIVLVMGESVRADHLSLNGYPRITNPLLTQHKNLISFKNVYTPFTFTAQSLPQILTNKSINDKEDSQILTSLYSVLNKASFYSEWIGNQTLEKGYLDIVYSNKSNVIIDRFHSFLSFKKEKDLKLLEYFKTDKNNLGNKISTLHMIGSHWYYKSRVTKDFEQFKPTIKSKYLGSLKDQELINSYDNTILYLDNFLNELIKKLQSSTKKSILIYISDHGETLGEDGKWLHAQSHEVSKNPAMLVWYSRNFEESYPSKIEKLKIKKNDSISTDFLFHSILDIGEIENYNYNKNQSIFY